MGDIYEEAVADRKRLLEVAESNAKSKIVDAITPRIKELVESALLGKLNEQDDMLAVISGPDDADDDIAGLSTDPMVPPVTGADPMASAPGAPMDVPPGGVAGGENAAVSLPDAQGKVTLDIDALNVGGGATPGQFELTPESLRALNALIGEQQDLDVNAIDGRIQRLGESLKQLIALRDPSIKDRERARQLKLECERLYAGVQSIRDTIDEARATTVEQRLERLFHGIMEHYSAAGHITAIAREMMAINGRAGKLNSILREARRGPTADDISRVAGMLREVMDLHSIVGKLYETLGADDSVDGPTVKKVGDNLVALYAEIRKMVTKKPKKINEADDLGLDPGAADMGGDAGMDMDMDMDMGDPEMGGEEADKVLLKLELPTSLAGIGPEAIQVVGVEPHAEEDEMPGAEGDVGDDVSDLDDMGADMGDEGGEDLEGEEDVEEETYEEGDTDEGMYEEAKLSDDDIIEIDEAALVQEMKNMRKVREAKKLSKGPKNPNQGSKGGHGPAHFDAFGGGHDDGEKFIDGEDINAHDPVGTAEGLLDEAEDDLDEADDLDEVEDLDEAEDEDELDEGEDELDEAEDEEDMDEGRNVNEDYGLTGYGYSQRTKGNAPGTSAAQKHRGGKKGRRGKKTETRRPMSGKQLAEAFQKVRAELAGQKLFNTKLVALNKVLQIPGLKQAQKEKVVEILDKGRTEAEIGQLYTKIVEQLQKSAKQIKESAAPAGGSASKPVTSSGPSQAETETHPLLEKWNKIAFGTSGGLIQG